MDDEAKSRGSTGVIRIVSQTGGSPSSPSEFLVSFGGKKDGVGAFYLGRASGLDPLATLLHKVGISPGDVETALMTIAARSQHEIEKVTLTPAIIRELGL